MICLDDSSQMGSVCFNILWALPLVIKISDVRGEDENQRLD